MCVANASISGRYSKDLSIQSDRSIDRLAHYRRVLISFSGYVGIVFTVNKIFMYTPFCNKSTIVVFTFVKNTVYFSRILSIVFKTSSLIYHKGGRYIELCLHI